MASTKPMWKCKIKAPAEARLTFHSSKVTGCNSQAKKSVSPCLNT